MVFPLHKRKDVVDWGHTEPTQDDVVVVEDGVGPGQLVEPFEVLMRLGRRAEREELLAKHNERVARLGVTGNEAAVGGSPLRPLT